MGDGVVDRRLVLQGAAMSWLSSLFGFDWHGASGAVDRRTVEALSSAAMRLARWDTSGVTSSAIAVAQREAMLALTLPCPVDLQSDLHAAVGEICHTVGYIAFDQGDLRDARAAYADCLEVAGEAGGTLELSLTHRARQSLGRAQLTPARGNNVQPRKALEWTSGGTNARLTASERALAHQVKARAYAVLGDHQAVTWAVGLADEEHSQSTPASDPPWVAAGGEAEYLGDTGHALADLALAYPDTAKQVVRDADRRLLAAAHHPDAHRRTRLFSRLVAAALSMRYVDAGRAVEIASPAIELAPFAPSAQAAILARQLHHACVPHLHRDDVAWLHDQLHHLTKPPHAAGC
jgi:hypothetical protein